MEILNRRGLPQKLGVHANAEVPAGLFIGPAFQQRDEQALDGPRNNRAPNIDDVIKVRVLEQIADIFANPHDLLEVQATVFIAWSSDADHGNIPQLLSVRGGS